MHYQTCNDNIIYECILVCRPCSDKGYIPVDQGRSNACDRNTRSG